MEDSVFGRLMSVASDAVQNYGDLPLYVMDTEYVFSDWHSDHWCPLLECREALGIHGLSLHSSYDEAVKARDRLSSGMVTTVASLGLSSPEVTWTNNVMVLRSRGIAVGHLLIEKMGSMAEGRQRFLYNISCCASMPEGAAIVRWSFTCRVIACLVLQHADDYGLVLHPAISPIQVVVQLILFKNEHSTWEKTVAFGEEVRQLLESHGVRVKLDARRDVRPGWKFRYYRVRGVQLMLSIGQRELEQRCVKLQTRDGNIKDVPVENALKVIQEMLLFQVVN